MVAHSDCVRAPAVEHHHRVRVLLELKYANGASAVTWYETAENRPRQANWLTLTPTAIAHDSTRHATAAVR